MTTANNTNISDLSFNPILTGDQVGEGENNYKEQSQNRGIGRRIALSVASKTKTELKTIMSETPEVFVDMIELIGSTARMYESITEIMQAAEARMLVIASEALEIEGAK